MSRLSIEFSPYYRFNLVDRRCKHIALGAPVLYLALDYSRRSGSDGVSLHVRQRRRPHQCDDAQLGIGQLHACIRCNGCTAHSGSYLRAIASQIKLPSIQDSPVAVFNDLSWSRTDPVVGKIPRANGTFRLLTADGKEVPYQVWSPGSGTYTEITFIAEDVPSIGYRAYQAVETVNAPDSRLPDGVQATAIVYENEFFRAELGQGGIQRLYYKPLENDVF